MSIERVLVANRGEIAVRIIRACHELGLNSVAVYSDEDREAPFVSLADQAFLIGGSEARDSYMNADALLNAAKQTGADAVHPGYGFLAENAVFAQRCIDAGLIFVGPSPEIIAEMGSKIQAKLAAEKAGIPVVPGYHGTDQSDSVLLAEAERVGFPLLIKASAGGGGRGMRRVYDLSDFINQLHLARKEAKAAFGDGDVLLERFVESARHIEVQILSDGSAPALHLFERDCSIQRNHQKLIEEAPAPNFPNSVRVKLLEAAVQLTSLIKYNSVGTVEFIYDPKSEDFYFLEMNTRIQVEHPVTELITGIDLVEWQIRVASGEVIPFAQSDITCSGWAMEARIVAEDPADNFRPQTGIINSYTEPTGKNVRVDSGVEAGSVVSHYYDSMLSKVIVKSSDRKSARRNLSRALSEYKISGVRSNIAFLSDVLSTDAFVDAEHHTGLLSAQWPNGWTAPSVDNQDRMEAAVAFFLSNSNLKNENESPWKSLGAWRITEVAGRTGSTTFYVRDAEDVDCVTQISGSGISLFVCLDAETIYELTNIALKEDILSYEIDGHRRTVSVKVIDQSVILHSGVNIHCLHILTSEQALLGSTVKQENRDGMISASMPGLVVEVRVSVGDKVDAGQILIVLEAMKLLQNLTAPRDGVIASVRHKVGDTVDGRVSLVTLEVEP
jgi:acetyl-CoA carboxylase biotin carboxylase subunit